ncbi:hypothetical protein PanWU01x14_058630, partial [Parasponia andersonii]
PEDYLFRGRDGLKVVNNHYFYLIPSSTISVDKVLNLVSAFSLGYFGVEKPSVAVALI